MNYGELKTTVEDYLHRDDMTEKIPNFIKLGQARMSHDLNLMMMQDTDLLNYSAGCKDVEMEGCGEILKLLSVRLGGTTLLPQNSLHQNTHKYEQGGSGQPRYYARYGNVMELAPTPDSSGEIEIIFKKRLTAFEDDTDYDEILANYPNIYIYAAMVEATPFIRDESMRVWKRMYDEEVVRLNDLNYDTEWSGAPLQITNIGMDTP